MMDPVSQILSIAREHHQAGRLQAAEQIYRQLLQADPNQPDALHLLGVIARQVGKHDVAVELIGKAVQLKGNAPEFHNNLGGGYLDLMRLPEAVACFRRAIQLKPDYAIAHSNLGNALKQLGRIDEAFVSCREAVRLNPNAADAHVNLGNLGKDQGELEFAASCYQRAIELNPNLVEAHNNLALVYKSQGKLDSAVAGLRGAIERNPNVAELHNNLGIILTDQRLWDDAVASFRRAIELKPNYPEAHNNLSNALLGLGRSDEAAANCRRALELKPDFANAYNNLANALKDQGQTDQAVECFRRALELTPDNAATHSNCLLALQYCQETTLGALQQAHAEFDRRHAKPLRADFGLRPNGGNRRRFGFVSADLGRHPVGDFFIRAFENLRHADLELICYSDRVGKDEMTQRFHRASTLWRDVLGLTDAELANQIHADGIDVLFDLAGHTAHNRMLMLARKPAPIQVAWIGYEGTTGLSAIDYLIADQYLVPAESERFYQEKILRMPDGYICYEPPASARTVNSLPMLQTGSVTFGSFNNLAKLTPRVIEVWSRILSLLPGAKLVLKYRGLGDRGVKVRFLEAFSAHGVESSRLELLGPSSYEDYLDTYHKIDLALDPFPFNGGATTCESLWMGVPVLTCPGETFASRHSLSHLTNIGMTETIAGNLDAYVELAVKLANNPGRLAELRAGLRERMSASPLCDGQRFVANFVKMLASIP